MVVRRGYGMLGREEGEEEGEEEERAGYGRGGGGRGLGTVGQKINISSFFSSQNGSQLREAEGARKEKTRRGREEVTGFLLKVGFISRERKGDSVREAGWVGRSYRRRKRRVKRTRGKV